MSNNILLYWRADCKSIKHDFVKDVLTLYYITLLHYSRCLTLYVETQAESGDIMSTKYVWGGNLDERPGKRGWKKLHFPSQKLAIVCIFKLYSLYVKYHHYLLLWFLRIPTLVTDGLAKISGFRHIILLSASPSVIPSLCVTPLVSPDAWLSRLWPSG